MVESRCRPRAALPAAADPCQRNRPDDRMQRPPRIELQQLTDLLRARVEQLELARDVEKPLLVDHDRSVCVVSRPETENPVDRRAAAEDPADVPTLKQAGGVRKVDDPAAERDGVLDRERTVGRRSEQALIPARDTGDEPRSDAHLPVAAVTTMQPDDVEPRVLAALDQVVADDEGRTVPVVVPHDLRHARVRVHLPEHLRPCAIERDDSEEVVPRAGVIQRVAVRVRRRRALREVAGHQRRPQRDASRRVQEVVATVVCTKPQLDAPVRLRDHVRLARPPHTAPRVLAGLVGRERAHPTRARVAPEDPRSRMRHRPDAVVVARQVAAEGGEPGNAPVDRAHDCRRRAKDFVFL